MKTLCVRRGPPRKDNDFVIVPTNSLYIECLVGTYPLLEDFKLNPSRLEHKEGAGGSETRRVREYSAGGRALEGKQEDPDIEKKTIIEGGNQNTVVQPDRN